jgi:SAM-dependent methyltransferase
MATTRGPRRGFFDVWSRFYDFRLVQRATYRPVHDAVLRRLTGESPVAARSGRAPRAAFGSVLDLGCGTGQLLRRAAGRLPASRLVGCDFSGGMLAEASERLRDAARASDGAVRATAALVRGDAMRLPFRAGAFDAVVSTEAFHWFPDQRAALAEIARVLAPGGVLLLGFVTPPLGVVSELVAAGSRLVGAPFSWPTTSRLRAMLGDTGFDVVAQRRIFRVPGFLVPPVLTEAVRR